MKENWEIHWKDYYKILQLDPLAEPDVVKAAYLKLAQKYNTDQNKNTSSDQKMKDLNEAFEIISNPQKRNAYDVQYSKRNANPINVTNIPKTETDTNPVSYNATQSIYCSKCCRYTDMKIVFTNNKPASGTCPICYTTYNYVLNPTRDSSKSNLTLDEKINLLFIMLKNDKSIKFKEREWRKHRDEVKKWLESKGTASKLGECPYCKLKSVLANTDTSAGRCINPKCSYQIGTDVKHSQYWNI